MWLMDSLNECILGRFYQFSQRIALHKETPFTHTLLFLFPPTQHPEVISTDFLHRLVGFTSVGSLVLKQYNESVSRS